MAWVNMLHRCHDPEHKDYKYYGARGIAVADEWWSFEAFFAAVGPRPGPRYTIDRMDNDGDYRPGNVAWRTWKQQRANRRDSLARLNVIPTESRP